MIALYFCRVQPISVNHTIKQIMLYLPWQQSPLYLIYGAPTVSWCKNSPDRSKMGMTKSAVDAKIIYVNI